MNIFPENRTSSYVTTTRIHLTGRWEIGLKEIQNPRSWFNIEEWVGNFNVDVTNVADIEHNQMYLITHDHQFGFKTKHSADM